MVFLLSATLPSTAYLSKCFFIDRHAVTMITFLRNNSNIKNPEEVDQMK